MNIQCPNCGAAIAENIEFCPHCGTTISPPAFNPWLAPLQWLLALGAAIFGGVGACSAWALATRQTYSRDLGDLSGAYFTVGLIALSFCALCIYLGNRWKEANKNGKAINQNSLPSQKMKGEAYERLAFTFCKIATFSLLAGRFALPVAAAGAATFFALAHFNGQKDTRCVGKHPLLISAFWILVFAIWVWRQF